MYVGSNPGFRQISTRIRQIGSSIATLWRGFDRHHIWQWLDGRQRAAAFLTTFVIFLVLHAVENVNWFRWDAGDYWSLSTLLLDFPGGDIRGYFFPLLLVPSRYVSDLFPHWTYLGFRLFSSLAYAYVLAVVLPGFYSTLFGGCVTFRRRLVVPLLVAAIYPGLIVYPLSDLPAACLLLCAFVCSLQAMAADGGFKRHGLLLASGLLAYGAYNTRTVFLFPALLLAVALPLVLCHGGGWKIRLSAALAFMIGVGIAGTPQLLINVKNHKGWTPAVITTTNGESLFAHQLVWGMTIQRYETTIDPSAKEPGVHYADRAGQQLANSLNVTENLSVADYLKLVVRRPLGFAGIYGRHLVNGLDVRDGDEYTKQLSQGRNGTAFGNFLVVFTGLSIMLAALARHSPWNGGDAMRLVWAFIWLLPVLMVIPGAIETRFFLPLHLAIYSAIAFNAEPRNMAGALKSHGLVIILAFFLSASVFFAMTLDTMASYF